MPAADAAPTIDLVPVATSRPVFDPQPYLSLQSAWVDWVERLLQENRWPLSGNVDQWIRTWGEAVGQVGLLNINVAGSGNPQLERRIGAQFSYGRQLGRILDVLKPLVAANEALLRERAGDKCVDDFDSMAETIAAMKRRGVADIVGEVSSWRQAADFDTRLDQLLEQLAALARER